MENSVLTYDVAKSLLCPEKRSFVTSAEQQRPWSRRWTPALRDVFPGSVLDRLWDCLLMRTYDCDSGSAPDPENFRMLARGARMRLDDEGTRIKTLEMHIDHQTREDTPYISFTNCPRSLEALADRRRTRNGRHFQQIVVIDPRIRFELGLPLLHCGTEMEYYRVSSRYVRDYWQTHYLCLWEVTPAEVVGIWAWDDLRRSNDWYKDVIVPAVNQHRRRTEPTDTIQGNVSQTSLGSSESVGDYQGSVYCDDSHDSYHSEGGDDSDDSYERVCEENLSGELMKMWEDLRVD